MYNLFFQNKSDYLEYKIDNCETKTPEKLLLNTKIIPKTFFSTLDLLRQFSILALADQIHLWHWIVVWIVNENYDLLRENDHKCSNFRHHLKISWSNTFELGICFVLSIVKSDPTDVRNGLTDGENWWLKNMLCSCLRHQTFSREVSC